MENHASRQRTQTGAATSFVLALAVAVATYVIMTNQGAHHVLSVAIGFAVFLAIGGVVALGRRRRGRS